MVTNKLKGFLMMESLLALVLAILGITVMALIVGESRTTEKTIELKTDRAYAWHVMKKNDLKQIKVHDRIYQPVGEKSVYDATEKATYQVKN